MAAGIVLWTQRPRDSSERTTVDEAVRDFNRDLGGDSETDDPDDALPPLGVYRYATRGEESIEVAILGTAHDYDGVSTIAVAPAPCGVEERWEVLTTRWSEVRLCRRGEGSGFESLSEYREFFGQVQSFSYGCDGATTPALASLAPGSVRHIRCASRDGSLTIRAELAERGRVRIGGREIEAVLIRSRGVLRGENEGTTVRSEWLRPADGLVLRRTVRTATSFDSSGGGNYDERYTISLLSTTPLR